MGTFTWKFELEINFDALVLERGFGPTEEWREELEEIIKERLLDYTNGANLAEAKLLLLDSPDLLTLQLSRGYGVHPALRLYYAGGGILMEDKYRGEDGKSLHDKQPEVRAAYAQLRSMGVPVVDFPQIGGLFQISNEQNESSCWLDETMKNPRFEHGFHGDILEALDKRGLRVEWKNDAVACVYEI